MRADNARLCPNALLFRVNLPDIKTQVRPATLASSRLRFGLPLHPLVRR